MTTKFKDILGTSGKPNFKDILGINKLANKRKIRVIKRKTSTKGKYRAGKVVDIQGDNVFVQVNSGNILKLNNDWMDNKNPNKLFRKNNIKDKRKNIYGLQYPNKVYKYWTPFKIKAIVKIDKINLKDGTAKFIETK